MCAYACVYVQACVHAWARRMRESDDKTIRCSRTWGVNGERRAVHWIDSFYAADWMVDLPSGSDLFAQLLHLVEGLRTGAVVQREGQCSWNKSEFLLAAKPQRSGLE